MIVIVCFGQELGSGYFIYRMKYMKTEKFLIDWSYIKQFFFSFFVNLKIAQLVKTISSIKGSNV